MKPSIRVENLSKRYRIGAGPVGEYRTLRESLVDLATAPYRRLRDISRWGSCGLGGQGESNPNHIWALKDVSFEVHPGEVVGILGRNGAGKSTLLKVLSRITEPTSGRAEFRGRLGSLLEVGTGFHPELTGRENVYMNGAILGMSRREIARKFDEIVAFSQIEKFLDTPAKRYSSGMYVRLAFAVAAHLDPEILIVDEVLAVGDAAFQKRCIDRMTVIAQSGCTILFVSHNMDLIPRLCQRAVLMEQGQVIEVGESRKIIDQYLKGIIKECDGRDMTTVPRRSGDGRARFASAQLIGSSGIPQASFPSGEALRIRIRIVSRCKVPNVTVGVHLNTIGGVRVLTGWTREHDISVCLNPGENLLECQFKDIRLRPGQRLSASFWMEDGAYLDHVEDAWSFGVANGKDTDRFSLSKHFGVLLADAEWTGPNSWN